MRIATWNVNSLRSRIDRVEAFVQRHEVDVLALQETKAREDQLPADGARGPRVRGRRRRHQPVERRRAALPRGAGGRPGRLRRHARVRRPARGRVAGDRRPLRRGGRLVALRPQRAQARRPALRLQARVAGPAAGGRRVLAGPRHRPGRRLEHLPDRRRRLRPGPVPEVDPRHAARARRVPGLPRRRVRRGHPRSTPRATPTGTTTASASSATAGSRSTSWWPRRRWPGGSRGAFIDRDERDPAQGTGSPSDHAPVVVDID